MSNEYPKALYKGGLLLVGVEPDTITVSSRDEEEAAAKDGYLPFDRDKSNAAQSSEQVDESTSDEPAQEGEAPKRRGRPRKNPE